MKLLNYTLSYLSVALLLVIGAWAFVFYLNMLDEIYDSIDDGLENSKLLILNKVQADTSLLYKHSFQESNYAIRSISEEDAYRVRDVYMDSVLYMQNEADYEPVRILKTAFRAANGKYFELIIESSMVEEDDLIEDLLYSIVALYAILLVSVLLINNLLLKRLWRPFYDMLDKLKNFDLGSRANYFSVTRSRVREFNVLSSTIASLLQRTVRTFTSQKQFIENAAHELQTPLAISINKLELLMERNSLSESQLQELASVTQTLERLTKLNKTLLLLSRIENRQFQEEDVVNINDLSARMVSEFSDLSVFKSVQVSVSQEGTLIKKMNPALAEILISNLLKNAITHNYKEGSVVLRITASTFSIENTSVSPGLDESRVFERFYKNSAEKTSTGLGLAIIKSIADYYGLVIQYRYNGRHLFVIQFH